MRDVQFHLHISAEHEPRMTATATTAATGGSSSSATKRGAAAAYPCTASDLPDCKATDDLKGAAASAAECCSTSAAAAAAAAAEQRDVMPGDYEFTLPDPSLGKLHHFSSILRSADWINTSVELGLLGGLAYVATAYPAAVDVEGSMPLQELALYFTASMCVARVYNAYLEACYFACPQYRIQPPREHALAKGVKDLCGRDKQQLATMVWHDRATLLTQFCLNVGLYYLLPGYYPAAAAAGAPVTPLHLRALRVVLNHYVMSFGMYWMHRAYHVVPWLWQHIHSLHHWAKHPLSRNTYQDHWADNFANAIVGHCFAQILVPLDNGSFWFSHIFRIFESLEKHSGISCYLNLAHNLQIHWLPFAQMPHHHDW
eukprot:SAG22_NODE_104_length_20159_cov_5.877517_10_plen_371_part_00